MLDFPSSPTTGQKFPQPSVAGVPVYTWDGAKWTTIGGSVGGGGGGGGGIPEAPTDGALYGRDNAAWAKGVKLAGDVMSGALTLVAPPVNPTDASAKSYVDAGDAAATAIANTANTTANTANSTANSANTNANSRVARAGDTMTGTLQTAGSNATIAGGGGSTALWCMSTGSTDAYMSFHRPGVYAVNFGLASDNNFYYGGWSVGAGSQYVFWTSALCGYPASNARFVYAGDVINYLSYPPPVNEPYGGAAMTGISGPSTNDGSIISRFRYLQLYTSGWFTLGYA